MRKIFFLLVFAVLPLNAFAVQLNSSTYSNNVALTLGGESSSSESYNTTISLGEQSGKTNSSSFMNKLGFLYSWLLAENQQCLNESQCETSFCCSGVCSSSACESSNSGNANTNSGGGGSGGSSGGSASSSGGGAGGIIPAKKDNVNFSISKSFIKGQVALGNAKTEAITIKNTGDLEIDFKISNTLENMVFISESSFSLGSGQEKNIEINIIGKELGSFPVEIEIEANGLKKIVSMILEVESESVLFDAQLDIPTEYKTVSPGSELRAQVTLLNVGPPRKVDVTTNYIIKDKRGNIISEESETFAVEKQTSFVKSIKIPASIAPGDYLAIVELRYDKSFAVSSDQFTVGGSNYISTQNYVTIVPLGILIITSMIGLMLVRHIKKKQKK